MFFDKTMIILLPGILLALYAQHKVGATFNKFSNIQSAKGLTGVQVAKMLLSIAGIRDVEVEAISGHLTDHFDPRSNTIRLSQSVYNNSSIAAISVAAHETGHAIQHAHSYVPLRVRSMVLPIASIGSNVAPWLIIIGIAFASGGTFFINLGIILFSFYVMFSIFTLPVEFNASSRAIKLLEENNIITNSEISASKAVLGAAALTYVAATISAVLSLVRLILISNSRRND